MISKRERDLSHHEAQLAILTMRHHHALRGISLPTCLRVFYGDDEPVAAGR